MQFWQDVDLICEWAIFVCVTFKNHWIVERWQTPFSYNKQHSSLLSCQEMLPPFVLAPLVLTEDMCSIHFDECHKNSLKTRKVPDFQWLPVHRNVLFAKLIWTSFRFNDGKAILVIYVCAKNFAKHKNSKLLPPILLSKLVFQKDTADLTCGFVYSWYTTEFPKSRHAPGFKGPHWGATALSHRNTVNVSPRLCSQSSLPSPDKGKRHFHFRKPKQNSNISNPLPLPPFSPLLFYDTWLPFSPQSKKKVK